jgi:hypothetical protein
MQQGMVLRIEPLKVADYTVPRRFRLAVIGKMNRVDTVSIPERVCVLIETDTGLGEAFQNLLKITWLYENVPMRSYLAQSIYKLLCVHGKIIPEKELKQFPSFSSTDLKESKTSKHP